MASVEALLKGKVPNEELFLEAGEAMAEEMIKITGVRPSTEYKKPALEALTRTVLTKALEVASWKK